MLSEKPLTSKRPTSVLIKIFYYSQHFTWPLSGPGLREFTLDIPLSMLLEINNIVALSLNILLSFAKSFCSSVWGCCGKTMIKSLEWLQNRAVRITANKIYDYSSTSVQKDIGWPFVMDIILKETCIMTFKSLKHDLGPLKIYDFSKPFSNPLQRA